MIFCFAVSDEEFVNTSWVNNFETQDADIGNLDNELYQFKTVGRNSLGESPPSAITEARPLGIFTPPPPHQKYTCLLLLADAVLCKVPNYMYFLF